MIEVPSPSRTVPSFTRVTAAPTVVTHGWVLLTAPLKPLLPAAAVTKTPPSVALRKALPIGVLGSLSPNCVPIE